MSPRRELNPESSPAARFGYHLRKYREQAHLTQEALADVVQYTGAMVSMVERGIRLPKGDFARKCDDYLRLDGALFHLWEICRSDGAQRWFLPWLEAEQNATTLHTWEPSLVPGLLQTPEYARALFTAEPGMPRSHVDASVASRIERQAIFQREDPPMMWVVLDEVVLQRPVGSPAVMRGQLAHLLAISDNPRITLQIVPLVSGCTAGLLGAFVLAQVQGHEMAYLETAGTGVVTATPEVVQKLQIRYDAIRAHALPQDASRDKVEEWMRKWMT
ncbi:helix-turn-helix transcriptional regulator [Sphaerisporangium sp. TRM90804]|uniref:helix-turn-helix domain-containing protein n=1 Tax=Sphaerisporangium sp. TRM90804 TaxID=3031113 RepID=UPI00244B6D7E|nr:helix-turn-helix transcriptional regulator [Sphaerisporangium sp. TRM90804]MDH2424490.1 helix-turn-helix transcriptional regulator [Sphaerisporangium sp. TRM90804]